MCVDANVKTTLRRRAKFSNDLATLLMRSICTSSKLSYKMKRILNFRNALRRKEKRKRKKVNNVATRNFDVRIYYYGITTKIASNVMRNQSDSVFLLDVTHKNACSLCVESNTLEPHKSLCWQP